MDAKQPTLTVIRSPTAINELHEIWRWNATQYGFDHADLYLRFLNQTLDGLAIAYTRGPHVGSRPDLRYCMLRRRASRRRSCHVAVYKVDGNQVLILHIFHTAQDWRRKLEADEG